MSQSILFEYLSQNKKHDLELLICEDSLEVHSLESVAKFFDQDVVVFPDFRPAFGDDLRVYKEELHALFFTPKRLLRCKEKATCYISA